MILRKLSKLSPIKQVHLNLSPATTDNNYIYRVFGNFTTQTWKHYRMKELLTFYLIHMSSIKDTML